MSVVTEKAWDEFASRHPNTHILQTSPWGALKAAFGWDVVRVISGETGAQILFKNLPFGLTWAYIPKGPVGRFDETFWPVVDEICRGRNSVFLKVEPNLWEGESDLNSEGEPPPDFCLSPHSIQPSRTIVIDLDGTEDEILSRMKQKTRYNIRLSHRKGVVVKESQDVEKFHQMIQLTGSRDQFGVHSLAYYQMAYDTFAPLDQCVILVAEYEGTPLAAIMVFAIGDWAWYFYGASNNLHRNRMPTYLVQWEGIRWARTRGCKYYDLWGVPDADEDQLENQFMSRHDGLWGVYRFKRGFGGLIKRGRGPWDRVYKSIPYKFYRFWLKVQ